MEGATQSVALIVTIALVVVYLSITTWLTLRYRARTSDDYMVAARSVPAVVIGVLMMSEFIAPKSTVGVAQALVAVRHGFERNHCGRCRPTEDEVAKRSRSPAREIHRRYFARLLHKRPVLYNFARCKIVGRAIDGQALW